ncbi:MAG: murein L,D-transpeptidase catalytic domain family protein, partial [Candidatus Krumholzibacteria bacterium]|nr:murein L,D-transpeptidase catalytic domain family protein [Candidatus Krumholzibacteria bacterium]
MIVPNKSSYGTLVILVLSLLFLPAGGSSGNEADLHAEIETLYREMELEGSFDMDVFTLAVVGYANLRDSGQLKKPTPLSIIDYTKPSTDKRMVIVDIIGRRLLYNSLTAHGKNTGANYAVSFSNEHGTRMSSLGFFATGETYY